MTLVALSTALPGQAQPARPPAAPLPVASQAASTLRSPLAGLRFEENRGQAGSPVRFLSRAPGYVLLLTPQEAWFELTSRNPRPSDGSAPQTSSASAIGMKLVGSNPQPRMDGVEELPGKTNYFRGRDSRRWITQVPSFQQVHYSGVYSGIDLVFHGRERQLEYDFMVAPGADPRQVQLAFSEAALPVVDPVSGDLIIRSATSGDSISFRRPIAYQNIQPRHGPAVQRAVAARYALDAQNRVSFVLGDYDPGLPLVIDPSVVYSTYLGGSADDQGTAVAMDSAGNVYLAGYTSSINFPIVGGVQGSCGGGCAAGSSDVFISKFDPSGAQLLYSTYLGGSANDFGYSIAVSSTNAIYVTGQTYSADFPITAGAFQSVCGGGNCSHPEAFVTQLDPTGSSLVYSTYLGGSALDKGNAITLDSAGNAYITGTTQSTDFPVTPGVLQSTCKCAGSDSFITKLNPSGSALIYSSYLGGSGEDVGYALARDSAGNIFLAGYTRSKDFPTTAGAFQTASNAAIAAFVTKVNSTATALIYSTYLGGSSTNTTRPCHACATGIAIDSSGNAFVSGLTFETDFPTTPGAYQTAYAGGPFGHDAFVVKLNAAGTALLYSTYIGATEDDGANAILIDSAGNAYIRGNTQSPAFPVTSGAVQSTLGGGYDVFLATLDPTGSFLTYSSFLGGSGDEFGLATQMMAFDQSTPSGVWVAGYTRSTNFPVSSAAYQSTSSGANDAFLTRLSVGASPATSPSSLTFPTTLVHASSSSLPVTLTNSGNGSLVVTGITTTGEFSQSNTCGSVLASGASCTINVTFTPAAPNTRTGTLTITDNVKGSPQSVALNGKGTFVQLTPSSLSFGNVAVGSTSSKSVTLSNTGRTGLTIQQVKFTGANMGDFTQTNTCGTSVPAGGTCSLTVTFKPAAKGARSASLSISDSGGASPQLAPLTGTGT